MYIYISIYLSIYVCMYVCMYLCIYLFMYLLFIYFYLFLISLIADGPQHYYPACGHKGSSHLSPFLSRCKFSTFISPQPMVESYLLTFPRFPLRKKEHKSYFGKNQTYDFCTSRYVGYLLDRTLGHECCILIDVPMHLCIMYPCIYASCIYLSMPHVSIYISIYIGIHASMYYLCVEHLHRSFRPARCSIFINQRKAGRYNISGRNQRRRVDAKKEKRRHQPIGSRAEPRGIQKYNP